MIRELPLGAAGTSGPDPRPLCRFSHEAMACTFEVVIAGQEPDYARQAASAAFDEADRLEQELSRFVGHSDVSRINALSPGEWARVGPAALECLLRAARLHADTGGAFDVTVGALLRGVGGPAPGAPAPEVAAPGAPASEVAAPGGAAPGAPAQSPPPFGMNLLEVSEAYRAVGLRAGRVRVDLGAIGKGYALDQMARLLGDWSIGTALIHSGQSTVLAVGTPPDPRGWPLSIRDPAAQGRSLAGVRLKRGALSGSGLLLHGPHIIDPRRGAPVAGRLGTWALAPDAAWSDAISTAFMVMSPPEIAAYCAAHPRVSGLLLAGDARSPKSTEFGAWRETLEPQDVAP